MQQLSIGFINDVHGYLEPHDDLFYEGGEKVIRTVGGYARIATIFKNIINENPDSIFFDGGDTFHGTLPLIESQGEALLPILKNLNFSAMVGHWDFGYGPQQLKHLEKQLSYPVLAINVYKEDGSLLFKPYIIKKIQDIKVAVIGVCCNIIDKTMPAHFSEGIKVTDGMEELPGYINKVKQEEADIIIFLSHNGFPQDVEMIKKIPGVNICLSAHTHNRLYQPVQVNDTLIIQCGCHGCFVGHLTIEISEKKMAGYKYKLITASDDIKADEAIEAEIKNIMQPYQEMKNEIVGRTNIILHRYNTLQASMDDLLLSAIKSEAKADIAFSNGWRYGIPIKKGVITKWDLYNIIPMNPVISTTELLGHEIINMLEENLERTFSLMPMQQMGGYIKRCMGLHIKMRIENPKGSRIQEIYFGKKHLEKDKNYKVAFVTSQGVPEKFGKKRLNLKVKAIAAMTNFLKGSGEFGTLKSDSFELV